MGEPSEKTPLVGSAASSTFGAASTQQQAGPSNLGLQALPSEDDGIIVPTRTTQVGDGGPRPTSCTLSSRDPEAGLTDMPSQTSMMSRVLSWQNLKARLARVNSAAGPPPPQVFTNVHSVLFGAKPLYLKLFWRILLILAGFYIIPSLQFVFLQINDFKVDEVCYYNFKCRYDMFGLPAFNNIVSNAIYAICGLGFIVFVKATYKKHGGGGDTENGIGTGLHRDPSVYYALGIALVCEGVFSGLYHICPTRVNFQFDVTFMFIGAALMAAAIYQKRHAGKVISAVKLYGLLQMCIFMTLIPLRVEGTDKELPFWGLVAVIMFYLYVNATFYIYYDKRYSLDRGTWNRICERMAAFPNVRDPARFFVLLMVNIIGFLSWLFGMLQRADFPNWMLSVLMVNLVIYFFFYLCMKIQHGEPIHWLLWLMMAADALLCVSSLYFFMAHGGVSNKSLSFEESKKLNQPCVLFNFFDSHDIWHMLSGIGLSLFMLIVYTFDWQLQDVPRHQIAVF